MDEKWYNGLRHGDGSPVRLGRLRGVHTASILNTVVEYKDDLEQNINNYADGASRTMQGEWNEIHTALEACYIVSSAE